MKKSMIMLAVTAMTVLLAACGSTTKTETPTETPAPTVTEALQETAAPTSEPTVTVAPTATDAPTATPEPTATEAPTATSTPEPTATEAPQETVAPEPTATEAPTEVPEPTEQPAEEEQGSSIILGQYKGLTLTSVSQAEIDAEIAEMLEYYTDTVEVDRAAQVGDTVDIDFAGKKDGVAFDGGTAEGYYLVLGSGSFIDGFEDGLIGAVAGEVRDLNLTFPENYGASELAGQSVVFTVTVNAVLAEEAPELTDEFIALLYPNYPTVAEYTQALTDAMNRNSYFEQITEQIMATSEVERYDEDAVAEEKQSLIDEYTSYMMYYGSYYGLDLETAIQYFLGYESMAVFEEEMGKYAYDVVKNAMIMEEIATLEHIELTEELYTEQATAYAVSYGYETLADFEADYGADYIRESIFSEMVLNFIVDQAVITEAE